MRIVALAAAFVLVAVHALAASHPVVDRLYHCTVIARTTEFPGNFEHPPAINAYGQVAFTGFRADGVREIRVGRGDADAQGVPRSQVTTRALLADGSVEPFQQLGPPALDDSGRVAFWGTRPVPPFGQSSQDLYFARFDANGAPLAPRIESDVSSPSSSFVSFFDPLPSWPGSLLFVAQYRANESQHGALFRDDAIVFDPELEGRGINAYAADTGGSSAFVIQTTAGNFPDLEEQLDLDGNHVFDSIASPGLFSGISIASNVLPIVSYARFTDAETWQLRVRVIDPPAVFVDSTEDAVSASWFPGDDVTTSVNAFGEVAFVAHDVTQGLRRLFVADGDEIQRVVCDNGLYPLSISARAINSDGQIAFSGSDGTSVGYIARADPLQGLPSSCAALADGTACADDDPETAATCNAGVCIGVGVDRPTSCVALPADTPCDDGDPQTLAYCEGASCVAASFVPEPGAGSEALMFVALASLWSARHRER